VKRYFDEQNTTTGYVQVQHTILKVSQLSQGVCVNIAYEKYHIVIRVEGTINQFYIYIVILFSVSFSYFMQTAGIINVEGVNTYLKFEIATL
jgi:hypothetical protein